MNKFSPIGKYFTRTRIGSSIDRGSGGSQFIKRKASIIMNNQNQTPENQNKNQQKNQNKNQNQNQNKNRNPQGQGENKSKQEPQD